MKTLAIIQARTGSTRLPNKVLKDIEGKPMLWHIAKRVAVAKGVDDIVIATSANPKDDAIEKLAKTNKFNIFRGSEEDCLDRFYQTALRYDADVIVRVTGDCPLVCPGVIDKVITEHRKAGSDYTTNTLLYTYPDGCDVEVFSFRALKKAWRESHDAVGREHVTSYIRHSGKFVLRNVASETPVNPREYKWSVDCSKDLKFARTVYNCLYNHKRLFLLNDVLVLLKKRPDIRAINSEVIMNKGYYKSLIKTKDITPRRTKIKKSLAMKKKTKELIPDCSQTFSKGPSQFVQGVSPVFLEKGKGSHVWDVDGNDYIDYAMGLGPVILGHNYPPVTKAVREALHKGTTFTLPHRLEAELAELLCRIIPCAEMVRFGKNGSDATSGAVRVSRAYTGRDIVACCGYHGWQDWFIGTTTRNKGVPEEVQKLTLTFEYNNIDSLKRIFNEHAGKVACVIMEPIGITQPEDNFLKKVKELTHKNGALLIFDEVVTGFRLSLGGAQEYLGTIPDLACFGKAMANGFPLSAIVGKKGVMKFFEEVFYSFTFGGETLSISAAIATIKEMKKNNVFLHLREQGRKIKDGYNVLAKEFGINRYTQCVGLPMRSVVTFKNNRGQDDLLLKSLFQQECIKRGILFTGGHNICYSHSDADIDYTLRVYKTVLRIAKEALNTKSIKKLLKGEPVKPVFRKA